MEQEIKIIGENGCSLNIQNIILEGNYFSANVSIKSDWYEAKVHFDSSIERLRDLLKSINLMLEGKSEDANFINDDGNFDLDLSLNKSTGRIQVSGILIKNMMEESRLEYNMETDYYTLETLKQTLVDII